MDKNFLAHPAPSVRQHTLARAVVWRGEVRKGQRVTLALHPAAADSGLRLRRRGILPEHSEIAARWDSVVDTDPTVALANAEGVAVRGVTTALAALRALGLDNALVEVDGRELPEGIANFYALLEAIADGGVQEQSAPRHALRVDQAVEVRDNFGFAALSPAPEFCVRLGVPSTDHAGDGLLVSGGLASDLTEPADGRSPRADDCVSQPDTGAGHQRPIWDPRALPPLLRARMIDTIGHLALAGAPLIGHMRGYRSGPGLHQALLRALMLRRAATRVTVDDHRKSLLADPDEPGRHPSLADFEPTGYKH
jgi:UDP-3-O-[3-hydroxymyristoyl] N-acetylglucosamine deacetylase